MRTYTNKRYNLVLTEKQINEICHALNISYSDMTVSKFKRYCESVHTSICKQFDQQQPAPQSGKKIARKT